MSLVIDAYCTPGTERDTALAVNSLLRDMDAAGIDRTVIAPEDRELAVRNIEGNDRIQKLAGESSGRLIASCTINPWHGGNSLPILQSAVSAGAKMLVLAPAIQGFCTSDDVTDSLLEAAAPHLLPVYVHTGPHSFAAPAQLVLLAARHPDVRFIMGHCGSTDHAHDMPAILRMAPPNIWYELSFVRPWALPAYAALIDESRLIFASSAPRNDMLFELRQFDQAWPKREHAGTYGENLLSLLDEVKA